jgi:hypothetical protein
MVSSFLRFFFSSFFFFFFFGGRTYIGNESALQDSQQSAACEERRSTREPVLSHGHDRPEYHLGWDPSIRTDPLTDQLRGELGAEKRRFEDGVAEIVIWDEALQDQTCTKNLIDFFLRPTSRKKKKKKKERSAYRW